MAYDDFLDSLFNLDIKEDDKTRYELRKHIKEAYELVKDKNITDWQKVKLEDAIRAYQISFFRLCIVCLADVFTDPEEITKDKRHLEYLKKCADEVNLDKLMRTL